VTRAALLDAGPLVAYLDRRDSHHEWASEQFASLPPPLLTNEAVLAEACHLLRTIPGGGAAVVAMLRTGALRAEFALADHAEHVEALLRKYESVPMSLADACLVRMSEIHSSCHVLTMDADFRIYRRHGRKVIPATMPPAR
jgi:predicted nucleic acid-binding protein